MGIGAGKYDDLCTHVREQAHAEGALVIVFDGDKGSGFSCQAPIEYMHKIPAILEETIRQMRNDMKG
jgi:hypothetical protein